MTVYPLQANMTRGELSPYVAARADTEHYAAGLAEARNVVVMKYGGVTRAPGTLYTGPTKTNAKKSRMLRFEFNRNQVYAIEAGDLYFRFWTSAGRIEDPPGTPVEVVTPYAEADLPFLRVRQLGDVIYIWCKKAAGGAHQPRTLTRNSETSWTLALHDNKGGPYMKEETEGTTLTPAATGAVHPFMTSNATPSGTAADDGGQSSAWQAIDGDKLTEWGRSNASGWISYDFPGSTTKVADAYWIKARSGGDAKAPVSWSFQGNNGSSWVTLDARQGETGWAMGEVRFYDFDNKTAYQGYRIFIDGSEASGDVGFAETGWHQSADTQTPFNLVASSVNGINDNAGFKASDVGRSIRLRGSDNRWRNAVIAAFTNANTVTIRLDGHALPDLSPVSRWQLGALSEETGWPSVGAVYEDRLFHAGTDADPLGIWGSVNADYDNHEVSTPVVADDGVSVRLTGGKLDDISWLTEMKDSLVVGTAGSLRAVGRNNDNEALGPSNFRQRQQTLTPASNAEPVTVENALLFVDLFEQSLYEAIYTYEVDGYVARETSTLSEHLFAAGIAEIVYVAKPHSIVVCRRYDGKLVFFTYDRAHKVSGATLVDFGGEVESVLDLPGATGTDLWMTVKRTVDGATVRYVERLAEFWREDYTVQGLPVYAACAAQYSGAATDEVTGLTHLEGETLGVWADGRDIGDAVVDSGVLTLPGGIEAEDIVVGLRMPWRLKTMRLSQIGNQDGSGLGRRVTIINGHIDLCESAGIRLGTEGGPMDDLRFEDEAEENPGDPVPLRTGMFPGPVDDNWRNDGVIAIEGDRMYPATVRAIQLEIDGEP